MKNRARGIGSGQPGDEPAISLGDLTAGAATGAGSGRLTVTMTGAAADYIAGYARSDPGREVGGLLLGEYTPAPDGGRVRISAAIAAANAEGGRTSLKFTHAAWQHLNAVREAEYPGLRVVGWFHTHPGLGVFLSGHDTFIQVNFFNLPWQVAYVLDPVSGASGCFGWQGGAIAPLTLSGEGY